MCIRWEHRGGRIWTSDSKVSKGQTGRGKAFFFSLIFWPHHMACSIFVPQPGVEYTPPLPLKHGILTTRLPGKSQGKPVSESLTLHTGIWPMMSCMVSFCFTSKPPVGLHCSHHTAVPCSVSKVVLHMSSLKILTSHPLGFNLNVTSLP